MAEVLHFIADQPSERVDSFLARIAPEYSRSFWQKLCEQKMVLLAGKPLKASHTLQLNDEVAIYLPKQPDFSQQELPILYEDDDVLVINKPAGILTHAKGAITDEFTVADFVRPRTTDGLDTNRPGIVHRLDRGTSGIIVAARHNDAKRWLQKQFAERRVKKTYIALVRGHLKQHTALLDLPIERNPKKPQMFRVNANGKPAQTSYEVEKLYKNHTLVHLKPLTGRTHQLRVHLQYLDHPIVGDEMYGAADKILKRLFLHAASLELTLPSRERKVFEAPLPPELQKYLKALQ